MPCLPKIPMVTQVTAVKAAGLAKSDKPKESEYEFSTGGTLVTLHSKGEAMKYGTPVP